MCKCTIRLITRVYRHTMGSCKTSKHGRSIQQTSDQQSGGNKATYMSNAAMLSRQLALFMSTSKASSRGCWPLVAEAQMLPGWPFCGQHKTYRLTGLQDAGFYSEDPESTAKEASGVNGSSGTA